MTTQRGRNFLMSPGPTNVPERVLRAMQRPAVDLAMPDFERLVRSCIDDLKPIFKTSGEVLLFAANGHGAWEAALANTLSPGDQILVAECGHFSNHWANMAESFGAKAERVAGDWRRALDPDAVEAQLRADTGHRFKAVLMVQTDTATGITSDVAAVRSAMDKAAHPALLMVDAVASLAAVDFRMDEWRVDVTVGASQKALMAPPGLSFTAVSAKALEAAKTATVARNYWDWRPRLMEESYRWFCGTPPEHLMFALREAIDMVQEEGLDAIFARHARLAECVRAAIRVWAGEGTLELHAQDPAEASNSVSTILVQEPYSARDVQLVCRNQFNVSLGGGLGALGGKAFRIGHMGDINEPTLLGAMASVEAAFQVCKIPYGHGGINAAIDYLVRPAVGPTK